MAKVTAPLLSFRSAGSIAKSVVYADWRGVQYARQHIIPANPRTTAQQAGRLTFATLREMWKRAPSLALAPWNAYASGRPFTGMNAYIGENRRVLGGDPDMDDFIGSPGAAGGLPLANFTAAAGGASGEVTGTFTPPTLPPGWLIQAAVMTAFPQQAPTAIFTGPYQAGEDLVAPYSVTLSGLGSGTICIVAGWLRWEKPDGRVAYSVGVTRTQAAAV